MGDAGERGGAAGEGFWRFSLALYARPGVANALVALQDRAGHDVNLILFGLWLGATQGRVIDASGLSAAAAAAAPLNEIVAGLRRRRRALRASPGSELQVLRRRIAALELAAERAVQQRLAANAAAQPASGGDRRRAAEANLALCLGNDAASPEAGVLRAALVSLMRREPPILHAAARGGG